MKKKSNILVLDNANITINPNMPNFKLDTPEMKAYMSKAKETLKNIKLPVSKL